MDVLKSFSFLIPLVLSMPALVAETLRGVAQAVRERRLFGPHFDFPPYR